MGSFCNRSTPFLGRGGTSKPTGNLSPTKQTQTHTNDKYYIKEKANIHKWWTVLQRRNIEVDRHFKHFITREPHKKANFVTYIFLIHPYKFLLSVNSGTIVNNDFGSFSKWQMRTSERNSKYERQDLRNTSSKICVPTPLCYFYWCTGKKDHKLEKQNVELSQHCCTCDQSWF